MTERLQLFELLEEALDSDRSPEEFCAQTPELIPDLRRRLQQCRLVRDELDALFPSQAVALQTIDTPSNDSSAPLPVIAGYEIYSVLGRGGMGVVYKARHLALKRLVAIKMILTGAHASASERSRLKREAEALAKLTHPHIVQVYDVGDFEGRPFFTMEFVEGGNLAEELGGIPQPAGHCAAMMISLASAVQAAHQCRVIHRDLKPANVLLTAGGVPKISDFGLSRHAEDADLITFPGARMGTPSYMATEQASPRWGEVGPPSDLYALGAILYEMMTGRPPFRGESAADTERQLLHEEPALPSHLNARVPRDLETICLKCLQKDPTRRYSSAAALADDLVRFQKGEPIAARRVGPAERTLKWIRRRPAAAVAIGSGGVFALLLAAGLTLLISARSATRRIVEADLADAVDSQKHSAWSSASQALQRAALQLGDHGPKDLQLRLNQVRRDSDIVARLQEVQNTQTEPDFAPVFESAGLGTTLDQPETVAARIRQSNIRAALVDALDEWACFSNSKRPWLLQVVQRADRDPTGWRDHVRDRATWENRQALMKAAATAPIADQPAPFLVSGAAQLRLLGENQIPLLVKVQQAHPGDFWINLRLGDAQADPKQGNNAAEAIRYYQAAEAIRPNASLVRNNTANALLNAERRDDAVRELREAIRLDPGFTLGKENLGVVLTQAGHHAEAVAQLQECIRRDSTKPWLHYYLGFSLAAVGRDAEAVASLQKAMALGPKFVSGARPKMRELLIRLDRLDDVQRDFQNVIQASQSTPENWDGYAEFCIFRGQEDEYRRVCRLLLDRFGKDADPSICERTGRACLLLGEGNPEIERATAAIDRAIAGEASKPAVYHRYFMFAKGLANYRAGNFQAALSKLEGEAAPVLGPAPKLVAAMAHYHLGEQQVARKKLAQAVLVYDWTPQRAKDPEAWIFHVLRREAEQLILPDLNELIDGSVQPQDNDERLALLGICQSMDLQARRAQLWADAIKASPELRARYSEDIARAAAMAGSGMGKDASQLTDEERMRWRKLAIVCLSEKLSGLESNLRGGPSSSTSTLHQILVTWQQTPDFAALREPAALAHLSKAEQDQCAALWARVYTLLDRSNPSN